MTITGNTSGSLRDHLANLGSAPAAAPSAPVAPQFNRQGRAPKANIHPGKCSNCSRWIEAGEGFLGPKVDGKWTIHHGECPNAPYVPSDVVVPSANNRDADPVPVIYTVELPAGHNTFRIKVQADDDNFLPGRTLVELLNGPDNTYNYETLGSFVDGKLRLFKKHQRGGEWFEALQIFLSNPERVLVAKNCIICNRVLSTPESIAAGIGPDCAARQ